MHPQFRRRLDYWETKLNCTQNLKFLTLPLLKDRKSFCRKQLSTLFVMLAIENLKLGIYYCHFISNYYPKLIIPELLFIEKEKLSVNFERKIVWKKYLRNFYHQISIHYITVVIFTLHSEQSTAIIRNPYIHKTDLLSSIFQYCDQFSSVKICYLRYFYLLF